MNSKSKDNHWAFGVALAVFIFSSGFVAMSTYWNSVKFRAINNELELTKDHLRIVDELSSNLVLKTDYNQQQVYSLKSPIDSMKEQIKIIENVIHGEEKIEQEVQRVVAAINETLPVGGSVLDECPSVPTPGEISNIARAVVINSDDYSVPKHLILGIIREESAFCNTAVSHAGAVGYMQLMPETAMYVSDDVRLKNNGRSLSIYRGSENIEMGTAYIRYMLNTFGNVEVAVKAYNAGPVAVKKSLAGEMEGRVCKSHEGDDFETMYYCETARYWERVSKFSKIYQSMGL